MMSSSVAASDGKGRQRRGPSETSLGGSYGLSAAGQYVSTTTDEAVSGSSNTLIRKRLPSLLTANERCASGIVVSAV